MRGQTVRTCTTRETYKISKLQCSLVPFNPYLESLPLFTFTRRKSENPREISATGTFAVNESSRIFSNFIPCNTNTTPSILRICISPHPPPSSSANRNRRCTFSFATIRPPFLQRFSVHLFFFPPLFDDLEQTERRRPSGKH